MSADKMFEELGYKQTRNNKYDIEYERGSNYITFSKLDKVVSKQWSFDAGLITMAELKAINEKVKELRLARQ